LSPNASSGTLVEALIEIEPISTKAAAKVPGNPFLGQALRRCLDCLRLAYRLSKRIPGLSLLLIV
jgi:hypothetical protein